MNEFVVTINGKKIQISLSNAHKAIIDGKEFDYRLSRINHNTFNLSIDNKSYLISAEKNNSSEYIITLNGQVIESRVLSALQERAAGLIESVSVKNTTTFLKSPMPGMILKIKRQAGEFVHQGDSLLILEAMKMENDIRSPVSGTIKEVRIKEGQPVEKGIPLMVIE